ncbi:hypothetical protein [Methylocystis sp. ATCC 49242]|nr:hypothetical protein [Methylocystis sp. ATCC 49242]
MTALAKAKAARTATRSRIWVFAIAALLSAAPVTTGVDGAVSMQG